MSGADPREKFTSDARKALHYAEEASQTVHLSTIDSEQILLGLLRDPNGVATRVLGEHGITASMVQMAIERVANQGATGAEGELRLTKPARAAIERAVAEASRRRQRQIGPEHLFLGLLHDRRSNAVRVLESMRIDRRDLQKTVAGIVDGLNDRQ
jgi:ATP-dependent Clp protease ATP-binding subunit ClpC